MAFDKKFNPDELKQFLQNKYGSGVQVEIFPKTQQDQTDEVDEVAQRRSQALQFDYKPSQIKAYLDRYVIQQDEAKKVLPRLSVITTTTSRVVREIRTAGITKSKTSF